METVNKCVSKVKHLLWGGLEFIDKHKRWPDMICACLLALIPILQHYRGIVDNASTTVLALLVPYIALRVLYKLPQAKIGDFKLVWVSMLYFAYRVIDHGTNVSEIGQACLMIGYLFAMALDCIDVKTLVKAATVVCLVAAVCMFIQYFCYYILDHHQQMVPTSLLLKQSKKWIKMVETGAVGITGKPRSFYRPSSIFLEPAHLFMYAFPLLFIHLFSKVHTKQTLAIAAAICLCIVMSTSGMGIAVSVAALVLFCALWNEKEKTYHICNIVRKRNLIFMGIMVAAVLVVIAVVPVIRSSVVRIFFNPTGSTAIGGRINKSMGLLRGLLPKHWFFGVRDTITTLSFHIPGSMATIYRHGLIGLVLSYDFYVRGLFKLDVGYFWVTMVILGVSLFSAHTHGTFFLIYYMLILQEGHNTATGEWQQQICELFRRKKRKTV